ncbi:hypothetical protein NE865_13879 [Phthorimaea operculella]|nr:hypothetical protein NE865_13879 [Phthorimaea operculella]
MEKSDENMDKNMEILFSRLEQRLQQQTIEITTTVTNNVMAAFNEKMKIITEENENLKIRVSELENKLNYLDKEKRRNNIILFGMEEKENSEAELVDVVKEIITDMEIHLDSSEISKVSRIGKRSDNKLRPVVATITTTWKKNMIIRNKTKLTTGVYIKEDYSKETLEKRKVLQKQVEDERRKGNKAFIKYDKLIVKNASHDTNREKRKRETSISPNTGSQKKANTNPAHSFSTKLAPKEVIKPNIRNYMEQSKPKPETPKN